MQYHPNMQWDVVDIVETVSAGLLGRARADDEEQAVYGLDAVEELQLHPLIHDALRMGGYGVHPEQRFPSDRTRRRRKSEGKRCDIVLTPNERPLGDPDAADTLFAAPDAVSLETAYWLEVKTVSMFTTEGPFHRYSAELLAPVSKDIRKLAEDRLIFHGGLLLVLFTVDQAVADHDLTTWLDRCTQRGFPVAPPIVRGFELTDRLGNGWCAVALFPVRRL